MIRIAIFAAALTIALVVVWAAASHVVSTPVVASGDAVQLDVPRHFPDRNENETATRLLAIVAAVDNDDLRDGRSIAIEYIRREVASPAAVPAAPPPDVAKYLDKNAKTIQTLRALLASNAPPVWKQRANELLDRPEPEFGLHMTLFTLFAADALAQCNRGSATTAWTDAGAIWTLAASLWNRPERNSVLLALSGSRILGAIAIKLPAPAPRWWNDFVAFNPRPPLLRSMQYEAWSMRTNAERYPVGEPEEETGLREVARRAAEPLVRPIRVLQADAQARDARTVARALAVATPCDVMPDSARRIDLSVTIQRLNRFIIEREGVARLLAAEAHRARSGEWPDRIDDRSACTNERWIYARSADGIELSFSGTVPPTQTRIVPPLRFVR